MLSHLYPPWCILKRQERPVSHSVSKAQKKCEKSGIPCWGTSGVQRLVVVEVSLGSPVTASAGPKAPRHYAHTITLLDNTIFTSVV